MSHFQKKTKKDYEGLYRVMDAEDLPVKGKQGTLAFVKGGMST